MAQAEGHLIGMPSRRRFVAGLAGAASASLLSCHALPRTSPKVMDGEMGDMRGFKRGGMMACIEVA
ncbi:MAG: hypothetical protein IT518_06820 [Burkholderiales bacterium]|nr:hypothetical protein [Burkholderiales bacterium]